MRPTSNLPPPIACLNRLLEDGAASWQRYFDPIPELSEGLPAPFVGVMALIWQLRPADLIPLFDLRTVGSRLDFQAWCVVHGRKEYRALRQASAVWQALGQPHDFGLDAGAEDAGMAISELMYLVRRMRTDLPFDAQTPRGRAQFLLWYLLHGSQELALADIALQSWQIKLFNGPGAVPGLSWLQSLVYQLDSDFAKNYPLPARTADYLAWFQEGIGAQLTRLAAAAQDCEAIRHEPEVSAPRQAGVNVVGYAYGQLGIGEDCRMAFKSLAAAQVPVTLVNFSPGPDTAQGDRSVAQHVGEDFLYGSNLFCLTALEQGRHFAENGVDGYVGRFNIGYWPWELSDWPSEWRHLFALVDEVWASSAHTHAAAVQAAPVPVRLMPMAVEVPDFPRRSRADFGLPHDAVLFMFVFDLNSSARRKNPLACVQAFLQAFPLPADGLSQPGAPALVIKVLRPRRPNDDWNALKELQASDPRIFLIEEVLEKEALLALYDVCDCFVSLHRAEGFGRCVAEAMLLGKPVIVTGYSGNMTFTDAGNALLVNYRLTPVQAGDYPCAEGMQWADPYVLSAATQLQLVHQHMSFARQLAEQGRRRISDLHSVEAIGTAYAKALSDTSI